MTYNKKNNINTMHLLLFATSFFILFSGCTGMRYAQTNISQAIEKPVSLKFPWGEVYCGRGTVCAEIEVLRVDAEQRDGGRIDVTLNNRTKQAIAGQIALLVLANNGSKIDETSYENFSLTPRAQTIWSMPGIYRQGAKIKIMLRAR